ncbi:MAG: hypothetical protein V3V17_10510 [Alphaproteobacteria bacterium]
MANGTGIRLGARVSELSVFAIERSIVRRGFVLLALVLPGHVLNYALLVGATHLLVSDAFGIFYAAIAIINVLFAPSLVLSLFLARHFARLKAQAGPGAAVEAFRQAFRLIARWGLLALFLGLAALSVIGSLVGVESFVLIALIVLTAYMAYVTDVVRAAFQGLQLFVLLGLMGLAWMALRFGLGMAGLGIVGTPWAGLVGILASGLIVCAIFYHVVLRRRDAKPIAEAAFPIEVRKLVQFTMGFSLFSVITYLDVLVGYLVMERASFGVYAASSVLPKAIILLSLPVGQVLFPVLTDEESVGRVRSTSVAKGLGLTFFVSAVGSVIVLAFADFFCGEGFGITLADPELVRLLTLSAIPICLLRVVVMRELARGRDWHPLYLMIPLLPFTSYLLGADTLGAFAYAQSYVIFALAVFAFYAIASLATFDRAKADRAKALAR